VTDERVEVVAWDRTWAQRFAEQQHAVETLLAGVLAGPVQHIGSTSVPGLAAKPVIDLLATVSSLEQARALVPELSAAGWLFWPDDPNQGYRLWFLRPTPEARTHHLHVIQDGDPHAVALVAFRDALRADESLRGQYAALKHDLAKKHREDRNAYSNAKSDFVDQALRRLGMVPPSRSAL
jgi:GrpB-like predicted nucleotidyltransferase (UPF0157 family)